MKLTTFFLITIAHVCSWFRFSWWGAEHKTNQYFLKCNYLYKDNVYLYFTLEKAQNVLSNILFEAFQYRLVCIFDTKEYSSCMIHCMHMLNIQLNSLFDRHQSGKIKLSLPDHKAEMWLCYCFNVYIYWYISTITGRS